MALVTKNALLGGRPSAVFAALGVSTGLAAWTLAAAFGVAALLRASEPAFAAFRIMGAAYLIYLGLQALGFHGPRARGQGGSGPALETSAPSVWASYRQGLLSNLCNPKIGVFFTSFIPQFITPGDPVFARLLLLGGIFNVMGLLWLFAYAAFLSRAGDILRSPRIKAALDRLTGCVLIGFGIRLAAERH